MSGETTAAILAKLSVRTKADLAKILGEETRYIKVEYATHTTLKGTLRPDVKISFGNTELVIDATQDDFPWSVLAYCSGIGTDSYFILDRIDNLEESVFNTLMPSINEHILEWLGRTQAVFRNLRKYWNEDDRGMTIDQFIDDSLATSTARSIGSFPSPTDDDTDDDDDEEEEATLAQRRSRSSSRERVLQEDARLGDP